LSQHDQGDKLNEDMRRIAQSFIIQEGEEKITGKAKVDDLVECYESIQQKGASRWKPRSGIIRSKS
jgi:hypothetical protein